MSQDFFYTDAVGNVQGPYSQSEIEGLIDRGAISSRTEIQQAGSGRVNAVEAFGQTRFLSEKPKELRLARERPGGPSPSRKVKNFGMILIVIGAIFSFLVSMLLGIVIFGFGGVIWAIGATK